MFAGQGTIHPATTIREIRDRNGRVIYSLDDNGPKPLKPVTPAEAYLTHWILESNTDPSRNIYWGPTAELTDQLNGGGTRRHAYVWVDDLAATIEPEGVRLTFTLPAGCYATVLVRELTHGEGTEGEDAD